MGQKAVNTDGSAGNHERRERFLLLWPKYGFKVAPAAREAGYSKSYANTKLAIHLREDVEFTKRMDAVRAENLGIAENKVEALDNRLDNLIDGGELNSTQMLKAIELRYRRLGALMDKLAIEDPARERELSVSARAAARELSIVLMKRQSESKDGAA